MPTSYEAFFGLVERPFSLTSDPKYFFKTGSHGRALETLTFGLRRREGLILVTADMGVGKTVLCRALVEQLRRKGPVALVPNPLLPPGGLFRLLLEDFGVVSTDDIGARTNAATPHELHNILVTFLSGLKSSRTATVVVDEAHRLPAVLVQHLLALAAPEPNQERALQLVLMGMPSAGDSSALGIAALDEQVSTKTRLVPFSRDECEEYVSYRLKVAGIAPSASFTPRALDVLHGLSGGVPRLINLLCERALQEAETQGSHKIEPAMIAAAASALELLLARPRRFRWFSKRVS